VYRSQNVIVAAFVQYSSYTRALATGGTGQRVGIVQNLVSAYKLERLRLQAEMAIRFAKTLGVSVFRGGTGMDKNRGYNFGHQREEWTDPMPRKKIEGMPGFGARLAQLRKAAGYTQVELAAEIGVSVSQRNIAYYEGQTVREQAQLSG
jgi:DNA-binding XRE family transcriptional regulator